MIEILILFFLGKRIAQMCKDRGRTAWPWVLMLVVMYYGCMCAGIVLAFVLIEMQNPGGAGPEPDLFLVVIGGIGGAIAGATFTFVVVSMLPDVRSDRDDDDDDDYGGRPRRRRAIDRDDDDYDRPRRRDRDDDDDYDRPSRRYDR